MSRFLCISLSATIQKTVNFKKVELEKVNRAENYICDASGKAVNSARVLNQLEPGCVTVVCPLGKENSDEFLNLSQQDSLRIRYIEVAGKIRECLTLLDRAKNTTTEIVIGEPVLNESYEEAEEKLLALIDEELPYVDGVLFAGSRQSCWSDGLIACIALMSIQKNKVFLADYCGEDLIRTLKMCTPTIIKINEEEFCHTFGFSESIDAEHLKVAIKGKSMELNNVIIVTRGSKSTFAAKNGEFYEFPIEKVKTVNTTACGDSFSAGFLYEYVTTSDFECSLAKGTWCASRNAEVMRPGSIVIENNPSF